MPRPSETAPAPETASGTAPPPETATVSGMVPTAETAAPAGTAPAPETASGTAPTTETAGAFAGRRLTRARAGRWGPRRLLACPGGGPPGAPSRPWRCGWGPAPRLSCSPSWRAGCSASTAAAGCSGSTRWFLERFTWWDSFHFLRIVDRGYLSLAKGGGDQAFFPGYPIAVRALMPLTGGNAAMAGFVVSVLAGTVAAAVLWHLGRIATGSERGGRAAVLVLAVAPYGFFLVTVYSEARSSRARSAHGRPR